MNGQIAFIYLQQVSVDDLPQNASDHWPNIPPLPAPSPRPHRTAVLGTAPGHLFKPGRPPDRAQVAPAPYTPMIDTDAPLPRGIGGLGAPRA